MAITGRESSPAKARITAQNQISVPKVIRDHLGVGPGDDLLFEPRPDGAALVRRRKRVSILDLAGIAAGGPLPPIDDPKELKRIIGEGIADQVVRKQHKIARQSSSSR